MPLGLRECCWNTSSACLAPFPVIAVKALLCALWLQPCGQSWLSSQSPSRKWRRRRRRKGGSRAKPWWETEGLWGESVGKVRKKNETRTQQV